MRSDFLDTSNPYRLIAFFKFCDVANMAQCAKVSPQVARNEYAPTLVAILEGDRRRAIERLFELFDPFIPAYPSSWPKSD